eukprot:916609-Rhodomonas_salina.7
MMDQGIRDQETGLFASANQHFACLFKPLLVSLKLLELFPVACRELTQTSACAQRPRRRSSKLQTSTAASGCRTRPCMPSGLTRATTPKRTRCCTFPRVDQHPRSSRARLQGCVDEVLMAVLVPDRAEHKTRSWSWKR